MSKSLWMVEYGNPKTGAVDNMTIEAESKEDCMKKATQSLNAIGLHKRDIILCEDIMNAPMESLL